MNKSKLNIIFITFFSLYKKITDIKTIGGIEVNTENVILELRKRGHNVWAIEKDPNEPEWIRDGDVDIIATSSFDPLTLFKLLRLKKKFKKTAAVVIHAHTTVEDIAGNFLPDTNIFNSIFKFWLKLLYSTANLLITPSQYSKQCILNFQHSRTYPIYVVSNGIRIEKFKEKKDFRQNFRNFLFENYAIPKQATIILNVGLTWKKKGVNKFANIAKSFPYYYFVWVGPLNNNPDIDEALKLKNVIFTGYYKDIREAYYGSDLFLNTSRVENQGIPLIEAAICELPIIASDLPAYDWIEDGKSCIKAHSFLDYERGIQKIINDKDYAKNLIQNAKKKVLEYHDFSKIGEKIEKLYKKAILIKYLWNSKNA